MKKTMMFAVILMPLVILGMLFLGGTIVYQSTYLYVEYIEFVDKEITLDKPTDIDVSQMLQVNVYPKLANNKEITFLSDNEDIAVVDSEGKVTSRDMGTTYIYAVSKENSTKIAACKVTVTSDRVHRVWVNNPITTMYVGDPMISLSAQYVPVEAQNAQFRFTSSDPSVLSVSEGGMLDAKSFGTATITVFVANDDSVKYSFDVNVKLRVQNVSIAATEMAPLESGRTVFAFPEISFEPAQAKEKITYTSSNPSIATVDEDGKIEFLSAGTVTISAKAEGCDTVIEKTYTSTYRYVQSVAFAPHNERVFDYESYPNAALPLAWSFEPSDADSSKVTLTSSDESVIKIVDGQIVAVGGGSATITITAETGVGTTTTAECFVTINRKVSSLAFDRNNIIYTRDTTANIAVLATPSDATEQVKYQVSDPNIATFADGVLTFSSQAIAQKYAKAKLTTYTDSGLRDEIVVIYIDSKIDTVDCGSVTRLDYTLPLTTEPNCSFVLIDAEAQDIDFAIVAGGEYLHMGGGIVTLIEKGVATVAVTENGGAARNIIIDIAKRVERIDDIEIAAIQDSETKQTFANSSVYSVYGEFAFSYLLYPSNTTLTSANIRLIGANDASIARVEKDRVIFVCAGKVTVELSADSVHETVSIESTLGHPDATTSVTGQVTLDAGNSFDLWGKVAISPANASKEHITFDSTSDAIAITGSMVTAQHGGEAIVNVHIATATETLTRQIAIFVRETATDIAVVGTQYIYTSADTVDLTGKFAVSPATSNVGNTFILSVEPNDIATISRANVLEFSQSGRAIVTATLANASVARMAVVYTGDSTVVEGDQSTYRVLTGTTIMIQPTDAVLANATFDTVFGALDSAAVLIDGAKLTVSGSTTVHFGSATYEIVCVERMTAATLAPNSADVDWVGNGEYITGLDAVALTSGVSGVSEEYLVTQFTTDGDATVNAGSDLLFTRAEKVTVTFAAVYASDIIGASGICESASIVVESTFGGITRVAAKTGVTGTQEFVFDNVDASHNTTNIADYITVYPTQLNAADVVEQVDVSVSHPNVACVDGFEVTFLSGGEASISIGVHNARNVGTNAIIDFLVKRSATAISLSGTTLENGMTITVNKSTVMILPKAEPSDANVDNEINWTVKNYTGIATINANSVVFQQAERAIDLEFTMGGRTITVYLQTSTITYEIDIRADRFVVPVSEPFTFIDGSSALGSEDYTVTFSGLGTMSTPTADVYKITQSACGTATVTFGGDTRTVDVFVTANIHSISNVRVRDFTAAGVATEVAAMENQTSLITASKSVEIAYIIPTGFDSSGELIGYTVSTVDECASVAGDVVNFARAGVANITIGISYVDAYAQIRNITYTFSIQSTFGCVTDFAISRTNYTFTLDTMSEADKVLDLPSTLTRIAPQYGIAVAPSVSLSGDNMASVSAGKVIIDTFGNCVATVVWGTKSANVGISVGKYIDEIRFVDASTTVRKIVTHDATYQVVHILVVTGDDRAPTYTGVTYSAIGGCTVSESGLVTFSETDTRCEITVTAIEGGATDTLTIIRVNNGVTIISPSNSGVVIEAGKSYIFDCRDSEEQNDISGSFDGMTVDDLGVITVSSGATGELSINNSSVNVVVTERVSAITFGATAPSDGYVTALGSGADGRAINIPALYAPAISPITARPSVGEYVIAYSVDNANIAHVEGDDLVFTRAGTVTLRFFVDGVEATRTIQSTMGTILSVTIEEEYAGEIVRDYSLGSYTLPEGYYTAFPSDYYATSVTLSSGDDSVFTTENNTIYFVGGGSATLSLNYLSPNGAQSVSKTVRVLHRAAGVNIINNSQQTGYIVTNYAVNTTLPLQYECVATSFGVKLSMHHLVFTSTNTSVATVDSMGLVTVCGSGEANIVVKVVNDYDDAVDATASVKIVNDPSYNVFAVPNGGTGLDFVIDYTDSRQAIIYPMPSRAVADFAFAVTSGNSVSVDAAGQVNILSGGASTVSVSAGDWTQTLTIYIYRVAQISLPATLQNAIDTNTTVVTSYTDYDIGATFGTADAMERKTIEYRSSNTSVATVLGGMITFYTGQEVKITVSVLYNGLSEASRTFSIRSTRGKAESFELYYTQTEVRVGESIQFVVTNVQPLDLVNGTMTARTNNEASHGLSVNGNILTLTGKKAGLGDITIGFGGCDSSTKVTVKVIQLTTGIDFVYNGKVVSAIQTSSKVISLAALARPDDATDRGVTMRLVSGPASLSGDEVVFTAFGTAVIEAKASDCAESGTTKTIEIAYQDITSFILSPNAGQAIVGDDGVVYVKADVNTLELFINAEPAGTLDDEILGNFRVTQGSATVNVASGCVVVPLAKYNEQPIFATTITVGYKELSQTISIYRDGISSVAFVSHDNSVEEKECGLQNIRVIGNYSYYTEKDDETKGKIENFYLMPIKYTAGADVNGIVWSLSNTSIPLELVMPTDKDNQTYVKLTLGNAPFSSLDEVYNDDFSKGEFTLTASNRFRELTKYTFHIVNAVNVWNQAGYVNGGAEIVLQKSLGHDDQKDLIVKGEYSRLDAYAAKTTIYGNGNLINYSHCNNNSTVTQWGYIATTLTNAINLQLQGSNFDKSRDSYHIQLSSPQRIAYCTMFNMFRAVELGGNDTVYIKNSLFRTFAHSTINASNEGARKIYLDNVIMFDVGYRAIECQSADDKVYIKGVFDVYNFQNKDALDSVSDSSFISYANTIITEAKSNNLAVEARNEYWVNVVILATKQSDYLIWTKDPKTKVYHWNGTDYTEDLSGLGLGSVQSDVYGIKAWATKYDHEYIKWGNEYNADGTFNDTYMQSTITKIQRVPQVVATVSTSASQ